MAATGTAHRITNLTVYPWEDEGGLVCQQVRITPEFMDGYDPDDLTKYYRIPQGAPLVEVYAKPNTFAPPPSAEFVAENCDTPVTKPHATLINAHCIEVNGEGIIRECYCCQCPNCARDEACGWKFGQFRSQDLPREYMSPTIFRPEQYIVGDWQTGLIRL